MIQTKEMCKWFNDPRNKIKDEAFGFWRKDEHNRYLWDVSTYNKLVISQKQYDLESLKSYSYSIGNYYCSQFAHVFAELLPSETIHSMAKMILNLSRKKV